MIQTAIERMQTAILGRIGGYAPSLYLLGSVTLNDYRSGWSDIDILCLLRESLRDADAQALVGLRTELVQLTGNPDYRTFEGGFLSLQSFLTQSSEAVVYWGTSGQRITDRYHFDSFSLFQLHETGRLLYGADVRPQLPTPTYDDLRSDVIRHYQTIRQYAVQTDGSVYACGWLLDIARCLYTLRTGGVIAKTAAGEWALTQRLCNVPKALRMALKVRGNPTAYLGTPSYQAWATGLGPDIQRFADVLQHAIG